MFIRNFDSFTVCGRAQWSAAHWQQVSLRTSSAGQSPTLCISWFFISQDILWFPIHLGAIWVRCVTKQSSMAGFKYQKIFVHAAGIPPYVCQLACLLSLYFSEKGPKGFICYFCILLRVALLHHKNKTWRMWKAKHLDLSDTNHQLPIANIKRVIWPQSRYTPGVNERQITKVNDPMSTWPHA